MIEKLINHLFQKLRHDRDILIGKGSTKYQLYTWIKRQKDDGLLTFKNC